MQMEIFSKFEAMIEKAVTYFIDLANVSIQSHDAFFVALSGGNTPKPVYRALAAPQNQTRVNWDRVHLFWGDERNVPADHPEIHKRRRCARLDACHKRSGQHKMKLKHMHPRRRCSRRVG